LLKTEWWDAGVVMCLGQGADLHMAQLIPLPLNISCSSKSRLVLPFWCQLNRVIADKIQEGRKTVVCVCMSDMSFTDNCGVLVFSGCQHIICF